MINLSSFAVAVISSFLDFPFFLDDGIVMSLGLSGIASRHFLVTQKATPAATCAVLRGK